MFTLKNNDDLQNHKKSICVQLFVQTKHYIYIYIEVRSGNIGKLVGQIVHAKK